MECRVLSGGIHYGGERYHKGAIVDLPVDVYQRLRESGDVETKREQEIRAAADKAAAEVRAKMEAEILAAETSAIRDAEAEAELARSEAETAEAGSAHAEPTRKRKH